MRNRPPKISTKSLPVIEWSSSVKSGAVRDITHVMESSSRMRVNIASPSPMKRPRPRSSGGSLSTRMEMNTMLSIPSTISSTHSVSTAIHASRLPTQEKSKTFRLAVTAAVAVAIIVRRC